MTAYRVVACLAAPLLMSIVPVADAIETVERFDLPSPLALRDGPVPALVPAPGTSLAYALTPYGTVLVLDTHAGQVVREVIVGGNGARNEPRAPNAIAIAGAGADRMLLVGFLDASPVARYSLADPAMPRRDTDGPVCRSARFVPLSDGSTALAYGIDCAALFDVATGQTTASIGATQRTASGGPPEHPVLVRSAQVFDPVRRVVLAGYEVAGGVPIERYSFELTDLPKRLLVDRSGTRVLLQVRAFVELRDGSTGLPVASIGPVDERDLAFLAEGSGTPVLVLAGPDHIELWDVSTPAVPRQIQRLALDPFPGATVPGPGAQVVAPLEDRPWILVGLPDEGAVAVIDVRDGRILGRHGGLADPWAVGALEGAPDGALGLAWEVRSAPDAPASIGARGALTAFALDDGASFPSRARIERAVPAEPDVLAPIDGRHVALADAREGALAVLDTATGEIASSAPLGLGNRRKPLLAVAGGRIAVADDRRLETFDVVDGRLASRGTFTWDDGASLDLAVRADGTVLLLREGRLELLGEACRSGVDLPLRAGKIRLQPGAGNALLAFDGEPGADRGHAFVDLSDVAAPSVLWTTAETLAGQFSSNGALVLAIEPAGGGTLVPVRRVALSGEVHSRGADPVFADAAWPIGPYFANSVFRLRVLPSKFMEVHVPMLGGSGTRSENSHPPGEIVPAHSLLFEGWYELSGTIIGCGPDRFCASSNGVLHVAGLRQGFMAATRSGTGRWRSLFIERDVALNRRPVADAGADRFVECESPAGTNVVLDGSGTVDPDSTPGTQDDLQTIEWRVDGRLLSGLLVQNVRLALGFHLATLRVFDLLSESAYDDVSIWVNDTLPPVVDVSASPHLANGVFSRRWIVSVIGNDQCWGRDEGRLHIVVDPAALAAPTRRVLAQETRIDVRRAGQSLMVDLVGPPGSPVEPSWISARSRGGLHAWANVPLALDLPVAPPPGQPDLVATYHLDAAGSVDRAAHIGAGADIVLVGQETDGAGLMGEGRTSLRQEVRRLCATAPDNVSCRTGLGGE